MKKFLLLILFIILPTLSQAQETIVSYDKSSLSVLNEELRQSSSSLRNTKSLVTTLQADVDSLEADFAAFESIPQGGIIMWSGTIATIPTGWELADGSCSITCPDLRDRFIVGATSDDSGVAKTNVTGSLTQSGDGTIPAHTHSISASLQATQSYDNNTFALQSGGSSTTGSYGTGTKNIAVYFSLAYIIKT